MSDFDINLSEYTPPPDSFYEDQSKYYLESDYAIYSASELPNVSKESSLGGYLNATANLLPSLLNTVKSIFGLNSQTSNPLSQTTQKNAPTQTLNGVSKQATSGSVIAGSTQSNNMLIYLVIAGIGALILLMRR